tara:strand:+ start:81 stop:275 length:195 start_codon:yes stop_codon:yes gene_type:complete
MVWTAVVEDTTTGVIQTSVFHGDWSGKEAILAFKKTLPSESGSRLICIIKGVHDQTIYTGGDSQ